MVNVGAIIDYSICGVVGYGLRFLQDRKSTPKPDAYFQLAASTALSIVAYFSYAFYKVKIAPIEIWIIFISWMGAFIVTSVDNIFKNGFLIYLRKIAEDFLAYTKKEKP